MKWLLIPSLLLLSACLSQSPAPDIYVLNTPKPESAENRIERDLEVKAPTAAPGLESERIALKKSPTKLDYYAESRWPGSLPAVVQAAIVKTLEAQNLLKSVSDDETGIAADDTLSIAIQDFQAEYASKDAAPFIRITLSAKLSDAATQKVYASFVVTHTTKASANKIDDIVAAFDQTFQQSLADLGKQVAANLAQRPSLQLSERSE